MPKISQLEVFKTDIPLRFSFKHSLHKRDLSESIFVKVALENGVTGFGESLPRSYVTGNSREAVFLNLLEYLPRLRGSELKNPEGAGPIIDGLEGIEGEARCAIETALLDCLGKIAGKPLYDILGRAVNKTFVYSAVIPGASLLKSAICAIYFRSRGYRFIKIKVGSDNDVAMVRIVRALLKHADIRIDANGAWDAASALGMIERLRQFGISCIEQPTPKRDLDAMKEVSDSCTEPIMADESLCTKEDALKLAQGRVCDMFNVRLSKCGGIFRSLEIIKIADQYEIPYQIGCHVGESGILTAAAAHLAAVARGMKYFEGGYSRLLLKEDIIEEDLTPERGMGSVPDLPGLGVKVKEDVLRKYSKESMVIT